MLSAYEFARHYHMVLARHPLSIRNLPAAPTKPGAVPRIFDCPGHAEGQGWKTEIWWQKNDYRIRDDGGESWVPLGTGAHVKAYRHDWAITQRNRPHVPVLYGAQGSQTEDEQAMKLLVLFSPLGQHKRGSIGLGAIHRQLAPSTHARLA